MTLDSYWFEFRFQENIIDWKTAIKLGKKKRSFWVLIDRHGKNCNCPFCNPVAFRRFEKCYCSGKSGFRKPLTKGGWWVSWLKFRKHSYYLRLSFDKLNKRFGDDPIDFIT